MLRSPTHAPRSPSQSRPTSRERERRPVAIEEVTSAEPVSR